MIDVEVIQCSIEEYWSDFVCKEQFFVEFVRCVFYQFQFVMQLLCQIFINCSIEIWVIQFFNNVDFLNGVVFIVLIEIGFVFIKVVNVFKQFVVVNWLGDWCIVDFQFVFNFIEQFYWVVDIMVKFVYKGEDWCVVQMGNFYQFMGMIFNIFCGVDNYQVVVYCCQGTIGIFREVFVFWGVEQVNQVIVIWKLYYRCSNGDFMLFFYFYLV